MEQQVDVIDIPSPSLHFERRLRTIYSLIGTLFCDGAQVWGKTQGFLISCTRYPESASVMQGGGVVALVAAFLWPSSRLNCDTIDVVLRCLWSVVVRAYPHPV